MLVLARRIGESIIIDHDLAITVIAVRGGQVRIGIEGPEDVAVLRAELVEWPEPELSATDIEC